MEEILSNHNESNKQEKIQVRKKMESIVWDIDFFHFIQPNAPREAYDNLRDIHAGEAYAEEFTEAAEALLEDETFWNGLPEEVKIEAGWGVKGLGGEKVWSRESVRAELSSLIDAYRN